jgi:hypothetical protein
MKRILTSALGLLALCSAALAQVNVVPQEGVQTAYLPKQTYSASFFGLVPVVTAATDQICISGSASKTIKVQRIMVWGTTATANQTVPISLVRRASLDTGGTPAGTTANPANTVSKRNTGNATHTAVLVSYTAAPTITDSSPTYIETQLLTMSLVISTLGAFPVDFNFGTDVGNLVDPPTLRGVAQQICVNNSAALTNASAWSGVIVWTEE